MYKYEFNLWKLEIETDGKTWLWKCIIFRSFMTGWIYLLMFSEEAPWCVNSEIPTSIEIEHDSSIDEGAEPI